MTIDIEHNGTRVLSESDLCSLIEERDALRVQVTHLKAELYDSYGEIDAAVGMAQDYQWAVYDSGHDLRLDKPRGCSPKCPACAKVREPLEKEIERIMVESDLLREAVQVAGKEIERFKETERQLTAEVNKRLSKIEEVGDALDEVRPGWVGNYGDVIREMGEETAHLRSLCLEAAQLQTDPTLRERLLSAVVGE